MIGESFEHRRGIVLPWTIIEREQHFFGAQEIVNLEVLESETGPTGRVDLDHARNAEGIEVARACRRGR
jgi:hypothetical protein